MSEQEQVRDLPNERTGDAFDYMQQGYALVWPDTVLQRKDISAADVLIAIERMTEPLELIPH